MGHEPKSGVPDTGVRTVAPDLFAGTAAQPAFDLLYAQLRQLARRQLRVAPHGTLCTTALVHEAWLKLGSVGAAQRGAFLAMAARTMRNVLIDHLRERRAIKRGGGVRAITLDTDIAIVDGRDNGLDLLAVEQGLERLEQLDPRLVSVVECHFFAGMDFAEIGRVLEISERTAQRDWRRARAFLRVQIAGAEAC